MRLVVERAAAPPPVAVEEDEEDASDEDVDCKGAAAAAAAALREEVTETVFFPEGVLESISCECPGCASERLCQKRGGEGNGSPPLLSSPPPHILSPDRVCALALHSPNAAHQQLPREAHCRFTPPSRRTCPAERDSPRWMPSTFRGGDLRGLVEVRRRALALRQRHQA